MDSVFITTIFMITCTIFLIISFIIKKYKKPSYDRLCGLHASNYLHSKRQTTTKPLLAIIDHKNCIVCKKRLT